MKITARLKALLGVDRSLAAKETLDDLIELLRKDAKAIRTQMRKEPKDVPNYNLQQAYLAGEEKQINSIIDLITITGE